MPQNLQKAVIIRGAEMSGGPDLTGPYKLRHEFLDASVELLKAQAQGGAVPRTTPHPPSTWQLGNWHQLSQPWVSGLHTSGHLSWSHPWHEVPSDVRCPLGVELDGSDGPGVVGRNPGRKETHGNDHIHLLPLFLGDPEQSGAASHSGSVQKKALSPYSAPG